MAAPALSPAQDAAAERPLPKIDDVLKRVAERSTREDNDREFKDHYAYNRVSVKEFFNSNGEVKKREVKNGAHVPKATLTKRDGDDKEDATDAANGQSVTNALSTGRGKAFSKSDFAMTDEVLSRFVFTLVGRETMQGRPTLVIDFHPANRELPENSLKEKFINKAAGRVWIDEEEYALVKADVHLAERVNVFGGLAGAVRKFNYKLNRERTEEGYWFTRSSGWHLEGRQVFLQRIVDYHEERKDVRKYQLSAQVRDGVTIR